jgi:hypothetical protein
VLSSDCGSGRVCEGGTCRTGSLPAMYQCPVVSSIGGGSWGNYWCDGQIWSRSTCTTTEFPSSVSSTCTFVGRQALAASGTSPPPGATHVAMYQCGGGASLGGGSWGYYECQNQLYSNPACTVIEFPASMSFGCPFTGNMAVYGSAPTPPPGGRVVQMYRCPNVSSLGGGSWGFYGCRGQVTSASTCLTIEYPSSRRDSCTPLGFAVLEP